MSVTTLRRFSTANTNDALVSATGRYISKIIASNSSASIRYLKLYDKATAPTVGTDTPKLTILIPGNASGAVLSLNFGQVVDRTLGDSIHGGMDRFTLGIGLGITTGYLDNDTGAVGTGEVILHIEYYTTG